jgi:hypothetical protein
VVAASLQQRCNGGEEIGRPVSYRPVETDGAARAARRIAELV